MNLLINFLILKVTIFCFCFSYNLYLYLLLVTDDNLSPLTTNSDTQNLDRTACYRY